MDSESQWAAERLLLNYLKLYLVEQKVDEIMELVAADVYYVGSGSYEIATNKAELRKLIEKRIAAGSETVTFEIQSMSSKIMDGYGVSVLAVIQIRGEQPQMGEVTSLVRVTSLLHREEDNRYQIGTLHLSMVNEVGRLPGKVPSAMCEVVLDPNFTLIFGNDVFYQIIGYHKEELQHQYYNQLLGLMYPSDITEVRAILASRLHEGMKDFEFEMRLIKKDGNLTWILVKGEYIPKGEECYLNCIVIDITRRKEREERLKRNEERFRIALSQTRKIVFDYDIAAGKLIYSDQMVKLYHMNPVINGVPDSLVESGYVAAEYEGQVREMLHKMEAGEKSAWTEAPIREYGEEYIWRKITLTNIYDQWGKPVRAVGISEDVSKQKLAERAYKKEEQYRSAMLADVISYYEFNCSLDRIETSIGKWGQIIGDPDTYTYTEFMKTVAEIIIHEQDRSRYCQIFSLENIMRSAKEGQTEFHFEHRRCYPGSIPIWAMMTMHIIKDNGEYIGFVYVRDIDEEKHRQLLLEEQSQRDSLTRLFNKRTTENKIRHVLNRSKATGQSHAFMILDFDNFKKINDSYGHMMGDHILVELSKRLNSDLRREDIIGRIGGDEFVVFIQNCESCESAESSIDRLCQLFREIQVEGECIPVTCSIGVAMSGLDGNTFEELYNKADIALYEAKRRGRSCYVCYEKSMGVQKKG